MVHIIVKIYMPQRNRVWKKLGDSRQMFFLAKETSPELAATGEPDRLQLAMQME